MRTAVGALMRLVAMFSMVPSAAFFVAGETGAATFTMQFAVLCLLIALDEDQ